ncbi:hypothetical protein LAZ67_8003711 [Cordylochernes scorpioides]|uniref:Uncharacterized protein n=1 Tax=Cordylochernes scorpioides TaxID=51811 RepID=A0ABY6KRU1_9ARAC|nr:hypothetical protein LAZ67_8003711 [Cordylochernes scorpioides]
MLTSLPVLAIIVAHFTENWGFYTMLTELPTFLGNVMHYDIVRSEMCAQASLLSAIPYLVVSFTVPLGGQLADFIRRRGYLSTTAVRKLFTCGAFLSQALFMTLAAVSSTPTGVIVCLVLAVGLGGLSSSGFSVNHLDVAPRVLHGLPYFFLVYNCFNLTNDDIFALKNTKRFQFAGVLMGISNCIATIPGIISPTIAGHITTHETQKEWQLVFFISAAIYIVGAAFYGGLASGERQPWAAQAEDYSPVVESQTTSVDDLPAPPPFGH